MKTDVNDLRQLRQKTGAGMLDCARALEAASGDLAQAEAALAARGFTGAEDRSERETREGRVFASLAGNQAALVEIDCETDFAALSAPFVETGARIAELVRARGLEGPDAEVQDLVAELALKVRENLVLSRVASLSAGPGELISAYVHAAGSVAALVRGRIEGPADPAAAFADERVRAFLHDLALHVAAFQPRFLDEASVPAAYREEKLAEFRDEVERESATAAKSEPMREAIVAGKLRKHLAASCLAGRGFVRDEKLTVAEALADLRRETGLPLAISGFACLKVGED